MTEPIQVLIVDDEEGIRTALTEILRRDGHAVTSAASGEEAMLLFESEGFRVDLLLTDVVMPEMNGQEMAVQIAAQRRGIKVLFMSGYTANVIAHHGVLEDGVVFVQKPFSLLRSPAQ